MLYHMDFANLFVQSQCIQKKKRKEKKERKKKKQLRTIHRLSPKFRFVNIDNRNDLTIYTVQKMLVLSGCANRHYCWYLFISLIILEGDRCSSEFRLGLRPSVRDMAVSRIF